MNTVLLVWEEIPETTKLFMLDLNNEEYKKILLCHNKFINSSYMNEKEEKAMEWLNENVMVNNKPFYISDGEEEVEPNTFIGEFTVIMSGFVL